MSSEVSCQAQCDLTIKVKKKRYITSDNKYQSVIGSEQKPFLKRSVMIFREKSTGVVLFFNQNPIERSLFRLRRRIQQNIDAMSEDFETFFTFTYDSKHIFDASASEQISAFLKDFHHECINRGLIEKYDDLKYLWKVEYGSHDKPYKDKNGKWKMTTGRIHLHMLTNIPEDRLYLKVSGQKPWFTTMWGRGIVECKQILPYYSKKQGKWFSKGEGVLYYVSKYFKKDFQKVYTSKSVKCVDGSAGFVREAIKSHKPMTGLTSRRWGTSSHYKTQTNPAYECLGSEVVELPELYRQKLEFIFKTYVEQSHFYEKPAYQWWIGSKLMTSCSSDNELHSYESNFLSSMTLKELETFVSLMCKKYPVAPMQNPFDESGFVKERIIEKEQKMDYVPIIDLNELQTVDNLKNALESLKNAWGITPFLDLKSYLSDN